MSKCRFGAAMAVVAFVIAGIAPHGVGAQQAVRDLRLVDGAGTALEQVDAGPGEKRYHMATGSETLHIAFDCTGDLSSAVQIRLLQPLGAPIVQEDRQCAAAGTQIIDFDPGENPLADNEYVVNLYVGDTELFLADSLQFTVGAAEILGSILDSTPVPTAALAAGVQPSAENPPSGGTGAGAPETGTPPGGPSRWMLVVAVAAIVGLMGLVLWAGRSAMRA